MHKEIYNKPSLTLEQQIDMLKSRGLIINNIYLAKETLKFISYYRFCGYARHFESVNLSEGKHIYQKGITFEKVFDCYLFDQKLRIHTIEAIERIEIAIRTVISNEMSIRYGSHWYLNNELFLGKFDHRMLIEKIKKEVSFSATPGSVTKQKQEKFINHYFTKYIEPELPPTWMIAEILSFGTWSTIFANLKNRNDQKLFLEHLN